MVVISSTHPRLRRAGRRVDRQDQTEQVTRRVPEPGISQLAAGTPALRHGQHDTAAT
ncbi:hypothetical protein I0C86_07285 [Plantactinospora sp. S1510]|uniref:Uncharacterized protein n=1 Tax=Plantactinospora alkalitolerans TaxID=2789879 RepID=A0ABS0GSC2_9ACTN|nr:hypothetical protein [Plantactinospora alkalitolerans]